MLKRTRPKPQWGWRTQNCAGGWLSPDKTIHRQHPNANKPPIKEIRFGMECSHPVPPPPGWRRISTFYKAFSSDQVDLLVKSIGLPKEIISKLEEHLEHFRYVRFQESQQPSPAEVRQMLNEFKKCSENFREFVSSGFHLDAVGLDEHSMHFLEWSAEQDEIHYFDLTKDLLESVDKLNQILDRSIVHAKEAPINRTPISELALTDRIMNALQAAEVSIKSSRQGPFCQTIEFLLAEEGIKREDPQQLIRMVQKLRKSRST